MNFPTGRLQKIVAMLIGGALLLISSLIFESWTRIDFNLVSLGATAYLAIFGSAIGFTLYFWLVNRVSIVKMSYTTFLIPILASIWGWLLLGEELSPAAILGAVIIIVSVLLPELRRSKNNHFNGE